MRQRTTFSIVLMLLALPMLAVAQTRGKVVSVKDGDTIEILAEGRPVRVRLTGIDCPEKAQPYGQTAKQFASDLCFEDTVTVLGSERDRYGRLLGTVMLADGRNLNTELVRAGLAWHYVKYSQDAQLAALETEARAAKRGLWADPQPVAPWDWRHR